MAQLRVDPERALELVAAVRGTTGDIEAELERLDAEVQRSRRAWANRARSGTVQ